MPFSTDKILSLDEIDSDLAASFDLIIVLGGGAPNDIAGPPKWVMTRCDFAAEVFKMAQSHSSNKLKGDQNLPAILTLSAGTAHVPQFLSMDGLPVWESTASAAYIMDKFDYVPPSHIYVETTSYDTISNAYFARTSHTDVAEWNNILVITNDFHMSRSKTIFDWIYSLNMNNEDESENNYNLHYLTCPDTGMSADALEARYAHEKRQETNIRNNLVARITNMKEVWSFLSQDHGFYTASKLVERGRGKSIQSSAALKGSYGAEKLTYFGGGRTVYNTILLIYAAITTLIILNLYWRKGMRKSSTFGECVSNECEKDY